MEILAQQWKKGCKLEGKRRPIKPQSEHIRRWLIKQFAKRDKKRGTCERAPKVLTTAMPIGRCPCPGPRGNKQVRKQRDRARRGPFTDDRRLLCPRYTERLGSRIHKKRGGKKKDATSSKTLSTRGKNRQGRHEEGQGWKNASCRTMDRIPDTENTERKEKKGMK